RSHRVCSLSLVLCTLYLATTDLRYHRRWQQLLEIPSALAAWSFSFNLKSRHEQSCARLRRAPKREGVRTRLKLKLHAAKADGISSSCCQVQSTKLKDHRVK